MKNRLLTLISISLFFITSSSTAAINIQFDYSYDSSGFFSGSNLGRRDLLDAAANVFEARLLQENFGAIVPGGGNTWSLSFPNPSTGSTVTLNNLTVQANTITIYVGARDLPGNTIGLATYQYSYNGNATWAGAFEARDNTSNFDSFGGAISFDSLAPWYFDSNPQTLESFSGQYDFYSVAQHEILHLLGFTDGAAAFSARLLGSNFIGSNAMALYGGLVPILSDDRDHWAAGTTSGGNAALMDPTFYFNQRENATELDFAALKDIGYNVNAVPEPTIPALFMIALTAMIFQRRAKSVSTV